MLTPSGDEAYQGRRTLTLTSMVYTLDKLASLGPRDLPDTLLPQYLGTF
ncbi:hypothetical protein TREES_T100015600 [Tupaia chinensis]|uniref:Uncharacterized protein n=1 Tax=Tupaia chinensis TaxID=246437 RepID=L9L7W9_TUPCH|nr:hypothetical protein TREES_T100015600 [Tupaia chinensis]